MAAQEADPLSFFAGDASSSSESEDEEEKGSRIVPLNDKSYYTSSDQVCSVCEYSSMSSDVHRMPVAPHYYTKPY